MTIHNAISLLSGIIAGGSFSAEELKTAAQTVIEYYDCQRMEQENHNRLVEQLMRSERTIAHLTEAVKHLSAALGDNSDNSIYSG